MNEKQNEIIMKIRTVIKINWKWYSLSGLKP